MRRGLNPSSVSSVAQSCLTLCDPMDCSTPGFPVHHLLPELAQTHVHRVGDAIQPSHPLCLLLLPSIFASIRIFSNELVLCIRWPKYWSFYVFWLSLFISFISSPLASPMQIRASQEGVFVSPEVLVLRFSFVLFLRAFPLIFQSFLFLIITKQDHKVGPDPIGLVSL